MSAPEGDAFWYWSLDHYGRNGVEPTLLRMQDEFDFNINIALWCCWCAEFYEDMPELVLRNAIDRTSAWNTNVTIPLRSIRRYLADQAPTKTALGEPFRDAIKENELAAEKEEQSRLEALADMMSPLSTSKADPHHSEPQIRARRNLAAYTALIGAAKKNTFTVSLLEQLIDHIYASSPLKPATRE